MYAEAIKDSFSSTPSSCALFYSTDRNRNSDQYRRPDQKDEEADFSSPQGWPGDYEPATTHGDDDSAARGEDGSAARGDDASASRDDKGSAVRGDDDAAARDVDGPAARGEVWATARE